MKIKLYIVTYRNHLALHECLTSLRATPLPSSVTLQIHVINNHSDFILDPTFSDVKVLHNTCRPDFSTGHLARSWNQAIIQGFESLKTPQADIVVGCQVDSIFAPRWLERLVELHKKYSFVTAGWGDGFLSFTVRGVRNIGLFDERFCNIVHQECDYFTRALIYNKNESSINDFHHGRVLNPFLTDREDSSFIWRKNSNPAVTWRASVECHKHISKFLISKYEGNPSVWNVENPPRLVKKLTMFYPYFEMDVADFSAKYETY